MNDYVLRQARWALTFAWFAFFFLLTLLLLALVVSNFVSAILLVVPGILVFLIIVFLSRVTWFY